MKNPFILGFISAVVLVICTAQTTIYYVTPTQATNVVVWVAYPQMTNVANYYTTNFAYANDTNHVNFRFNNPQMTNLTLRGTHTNLGFAYLNGTTYISGPLFMYATNNILFHAGGDIRYFSSIFGTNYNVYDRLSLLSLTNTNSFMTLGVNSAGTVIATNVLPAGTNYYSTNGGNGTTDFLVKWGNKTNLTDSIVYQDGVDGLIITGRVEIATDNTPSLTISNAARTACRLNLANDYLTIGSIGTPILPFFQGNQEGVVTDRSTNFAPVVYIKIKYGAGSDGYIPVFGSP